MSDPADIIRATNNAFTLAWELVELRSRVQISSCAVCTNSPGGQNLAPNRAAPHTTTQTADPARLILEPNDSFWLASVWRAGFSRITTLLRDAFPNATTENTLYSPPGRDILPYLYPDPGPDFADIGIIGNDIGSDGVSKPILPQFKLYDVTRRAINCLTLLHVDPEESLIPDEIRKSQARLVAEVLKAAGKPGAGGGDVPPGDSTNAAADPPPGATPQGTQAPAPASPAGDGNNPTADPALGPSSEDLRKATTVLSELTVKYLEAWDGYLRENYFTGGIVGNDETELIAYEAGRTMASLSWGVSAKTAVLEADPNAKIEAFRSCWEEVFDSRAIVHVQHQITALSTTLDDAYYQLHKDEKRPDDDAVLVWPDPGVPSQAIHAVKQSLDYWLRAVKRIVSPSDAAVPVGSATKQAFELTPKLSKEMRVALTQQADVWQSLLTGEQSLRAYSVESVTKKIIEDVLEEIVNSLNTQMQENAKATEERFIRTVRPYQWLAIGIAAVFAIGAGLLVYRGSTSTANLTALAAYPTAVTLILSVLGSRATASQRTTSMAPAPPATPAAGPTGATDIMTRISGVATEIGTALTHAYQDGYRQIRIEFAVLSQSVAVAYPLVEFLVITPGVPVSGEGAFITDIIWTGTDRKEEMKRVARSAFGPFQAILGAFATGKISSHP